MAQLSAAPLPAGRHASMPTTVNAKGQVLASYRSDGGKGLDGAGGSSQLLGGGGISFEQSGDGGMGGVAAGGSGTALGSRREGDGLSQASTHSHGQSTAGGSPDGRSTVRTPDSGVSRRSRSRERDESAASAPLLGQLTTLVVRIKGVVLPLETCAALLGRGPSLGLLENFAPAATLDFIPPLPLIVVKGKPDPPAYEPKTRVLQFSVEPTRHAEVRCVGEEVLFSLFRSAVDSTAVTEYVREAMGMAPAAAANPASHAAGKPPARAARVGVYFAEISQSEAAKRALVAASGPEPPSSTTQEQEQEQESLPLLRLPLKALDSAALGAGAGAGASSSSPARRAREEQRLRKEAALAASTRAAFAQPGFADLAGEILRNTMFNLMQEAAFDEFPVFADPIQFLSKQDHAKR